MQRRRESKHNNQLGLRRIKAPSVPTNYCWLICCCFYEFERSELGAIGDPVTRPEPEEARRTVMLGTISGPVEMACAMIQINQGA